MGRGIQWRVASEIGHMNTYELVYSIDSLLLFPLFICETEGQMAQGVQRISKTDCPSDTGALFLRTPQDPPTANDDAMLPPAEDFCWPNQA